MIYETLRRLARMLPTSKIGRLLTKHFVAEMCATRKCLYPQTILRISQAWSRGRLLVSMKLMDTGNSYYDETSHHLATTE